MAQEFVWPLALVYSLDLPDDPYFQQSSIKEWAEAGMLFAARSAHRDGSCDDYFPFEKAAGAAAFSLLAGVESYALLKLERPELLEFFPRRADCLANRRKRAPNESSGADRALSGKTWAAESRRAPFCNAC